MVAEPHMFCYLLFKWNSNIIFRLVLEISMPSLILLISSITVPIQRNITSIDPSADPSPITVVLVAIR